MISAGDGGLDSNTTTTKKRGPLVIDLLYNQYCWEADIWQDRSAYNGLSSGKHSNILTRQKTEAHFKGKALELKTLEKSTLKGLSSSSMEHDFNKLHRQKLLICPKLYFKTRLEKVLI